MPSKNPAPSAGRAVVTLNNPEHYPAPLSDERVLIVANIPGEGLAQAFTVDDKLALLAAPKPRTQFFIVWPGAGHSTAREFTKMQTRLKMIEWLRTH